jgi:hypothetical protein
VILHGRLEGAGDPATLQWLHPGRSGPSVPRRPRKTPHGHCGEVLIVLAYRYASAVKVGPFVYMVIVFTALIDWAVWGHPPTLFVFLGMMRVIGGGLVAIRGKAEAPLAAIES